MSSTTPFDRLRHTMSGINLVDIPDSASGGQSTWKKGHQRKSSKDFVVATPAEFVKKSGGDYVINKVWI